MDCFLFFKQNTAYEVRISDGSSDVCSSDLARLVAHFSREEVKDVAVFLASARLGEDEWLAILPTMPPQSRSVLRSRRDLPQRVQALLESFGPADLALAAPEEPELPWTGLEGREETAARPARSEEHTSELQ